jgi:hypothetical protein
MSWILRQPILPSFFDVKPVAVGDSVSKVVHKLQYWRSVKITVSRQFVAESEQRAHGPCPKYLPLYAMILAEQIEVVAQV